MLSHEIIGNNILPIGICETFTRKYEPVSNSQGKSFIVQNAIEYQDYSISKESYNFDENGYAELVECDISHMFYSEFVTIGLKEYKIIVVKGGDSVYMVLKNLIYSHTSKIKLYFSKYHKSNTIAFPIRQQIIGNIYTEIKDNIFFNCKDRLHAYNCVDMFTRKELDKIGYFI